MSLNKNNLDVSRLENLVEERQDEIVQLASELIEFSTVSPPGRNCTKAQDYVQKYLESLGCGIDRWEEFSGDPNIVAYFSGEEPEKYRSLILNTHIDVAEVGDTSHWSFDPFKPFVKDGRLHGRGASDMKGAQAAYLFALKLLKENGMRLNGDLIFQSVTGEEAGEGITYHAVKRGGKADFAIVGDISDFEIHRGQGGVITGWITVESPKTFHDGVRAKMIHAGGGVFGASAVEKMVNIIQGLQELERHWAVVKHYEGFPFGSNTINPAVIEGGRHAAFIADKCSLWITVHFYPNENHDKVAEEIEEHILNIAKADPWMKENPPHFRWGGKSMIEDRGEIFPSLEIEEDHYGIKALSKIHESVAGKTAEISMSPTVTDGGWLQEAGVPAVIYGPGELSKAHAVDESVRVEDLILYTKTIVNFILNWCNKEKSD